MFRPHIFAKPIEIDYKHQKVGAAKVEESLPSKSVSSIPTMGLAPPPQPQQEAQNFCKLCNFFEPDTTKYQLHLNSLPHQTRENQFRELARKPKAKPGSLGLSDGGFTYNCEICQVGFARSWDLRDHNESLNHMLEQQRDRSGPEEERLRISMARRVYDDPACARYRCDICGITCNGSANLTRHVKSETHQRRTQQSSGGALQLLPRRCGVFQGGRLSNRSNVFNGRLDSANKVRDARISKYRRQGRPALSAGASNDWYLMQGVRPLNRDGGMMPLMQPQPVMTPLGVIQTWVPLTPPLPLLPPPPAGYYSAPDYGGEGTNYLPIPPPPEVPSDPPPRSSNRPVVDHDARVARETAKGRASIDAYWKPAPRLVASPPPPPMEPDAMAVDPTPFPPPFEPQFAPLPPPLLPEPIPPPPVFVPPVKDEVKAPLMRRFGPRHNDQLAKAWATLRSTGPQQQVMKAEPVEIDFHHGQRSPTMVIKQEPVVLGRKKVVPSFGRALPPPLLPPADPRRSFGLRDRPKAAVPNYFKAQTPKKTLLSLPNPDEIALNGFEEVIDPMTKPLPIETAGENDDLLGNGEVDFDLESHAPNLVIDEGSQPEPLEPQLELEPLPEPKLVAVSEHVLPAFLAPPVPILPPPPETLFAPEPAMPSLPVLAIPRPVVSPVQPQPVQMPIPDDDEEAELLGELSGDDVEMTAQQEEDLLLGALGVDSVD